MMADMLTPIADGLWTGDAEPRLIGGQDKRTGEIIFPMPDGDAAAQYDAVPLSPTGTLWSWTRQDFRPKSPPYAGPEVFEPFLLGYVELPHQVIVETRIVGADLADLALDMPMRLVIVPFGDTNTTFAFQPESLA